MSTKSKSQKNGAKKDVGRNGNTRSSQLYRWFFTLNNYEERDILHLKMRFNKMCKWWLFEKEIGTIKKTPHLQGTISLKVKLRFTAIQKWDKRLNWSRTRNDSAAMTYCQTDRIKIYTNIDLDNFDEYDKIKWRGWQQKVINDVEKPCTEDRKINWLWDKKGNSGKSYLTKYLMQVENALVVDGKKTDIFHQIAKRQEDSIKTEIVIIDVPRASFSNISYSAIECIKNGFICSGKYEGGQYTFKSPHVYIFANTPPDKSKFSKDRWNIKRITTLRG